MADDPHIQVPVGREDAAIVFRADGEIETYVPALDDDQAPVGENIRLATLALIAISTPELIDYIESYLRPIAGRAGDATS